MHNKTQHMHDNSAALKRMNYLIGHLKGVKKMIEEDKYCIDIVTQNLGVISAIKKVNELMLGQHIDTCVVQAIQSNDIKEREEKLQELHKIMEKI